MSAEDCEMPLDIDCEDAQAAHDDHCNIEDGGAYSDYFAESSDDEDQPPCRSCHPGGLADGRFPHYCLARQAHDLLELDKDHVFGDVSRCQPDVRSVVVNPSDTIIITTRNGGGAVQGRYY